MADRVRTAEETKFEKERQYWNEILSALLTLPAELAALKIVAMFPPSFRSPLIASGLNGVFAILDAAADRASSPAIGAAMQIAADFGKNVGGKLCDPKQGAPAKSYIDKDAWLTAFWVDAGKRLKKAKDAKAEWEKILEEFQIQVEGLDVLNQKMAERAAQKNCGVTPISLTEEWNKLRQNVWKDSEFVAEAAVPVMHRLAESIGSGVSPERKAARAAIRAARAAKKEGGQ